MTIEMIIKLVTGMNNRNDNGNDNKTGNGMNNRNDNGNDNKTGNGINNRNDNGNDNKTGNGMNNRNDNGNDNKTGNGINNRNDNGNDSSYYHDQGNSFKIIIDFINHQDSYHCSALTYALQNKHLTML